MVLATELAERCNPNVAFKHLRRLERHLQAVTTPAALVAALRADPTPGAAGTATLLVEFLHRQQLGHFDDHAARMHARRQQHLARLPGRLCPAVDAFIDHLLGQQRRAAAYGICGLTDRTITKQLLTLVTLAELLAGRGICDWASVTASDIEALLTTDVSRRLATARAFFAFARRRKLVLVDPTAGVTRRQAKGYTGRLLSLAEQRALLDRWTRDDLDPRERVVGLLSLLHAASGAELRHLTIDDIDLDAGSLRLGRRPHRVPLDPLTCDALRALLQQRAHLATSNRHLLLTYRTRLHHGPVSIAFPASVLAKLGRTPKVLRQTRLADLASRTDPRVAAAALGLTREAALHYLVGTVDQEALVFTLDE